jgi:hypothetical protein
MNKTKMARRDFMEEDILSAPRDLGGPLTYQYHYEIVERPAQVGGGVRLYLYGPNPETGEQIDYGSAVFLSDLADPGTLKDAYIAAQQEGDLWMESQREDMS